MTPFIFMIMLFAAVVLLMVMILKLKIHPVIALFVVSLGVGVLLGNSVVSTVDLINKGFGGTLTGIGLTIIMGSILAIGIQDTGAATAISNFFIRLFHGKRLEFAPSLTAFIVSIPVFGDITMVLTAPIASILSHRRKISMSSMASFTGLGLFLTHGLVPPTPGILAIALMFKADLGAVIGWGIVISIVAFFATWLVMHKWIEKEYIEPRADFIENVEAAKGDMTVADLLIKEDNIPAFIPSTLPLLMPVILISLASFAKLGLDAKSPVLAVVNVLGDKVIALTVGVICAILLVYGRKSKVVALAHAQEKMGGNPSTVELTLGNWVTRGLKVALLPLLITAMGGAFGGILKAAPVVKELGTIIASIQILPVIIPFLIAAVLMTAVGSMTMAGLTAAAVVEPMMPMLGISPVLAVLAIGAGTMTVNHMNNSGFWVMSQFFNLDTRQSLKYVTLPTFVAALFLLAILCGLSMFGIL